jgi:hypothetical protein
MKKNIKIAIEEYQCSGCVIGGDTTCFESRGEGYGCGCGKHCAGTYVYPLVGNVYLGMPKGFNRLGEFEKMKPNIYETFDDHYDIFNIPVWKYLSKDGHTFVRGLRPRKNEPFINIFLENCMDKIDCLGITEEVREAMD